jgi:glycosyltransferase involved in cell wall biosynthesis
MQRFSIAFCCFNSEERIATALAAVTQNVPREVPIIVVDDGSLDKTADIASNFEISLVRLPSNRGYGKARQTALEACNSEILIFLDDSSIIDAHWWSNLQSVWSDAPGETIAIAGPMLARVQRNMFGYSERHNPFIPNYSLGQTKLKLAIRLQNYLAGSAQLKSGYVFSCANGNLGVRLKEVLSIGGYDIECRIGGEDEDLCERIVQNFGTKSIWFDTTLAVAQIDSFSFRSILRRSFRYGKVSARRFRLKGGIPTFFPLPTALIVLTTFSLYSRGIAHELLTLVIFPLLIPMSNRTLNLKNFLRIYFDFYIRFCIETANNVGFVYFLISELGKNRKEEEFS